LNTRRHSRHRSMVDQNQQGVCKKPTLCRGHKIHNTNRSRINYLEQTIRQYCSPLV
ncbi:hypothetical protein BAE44_0017269, partial [Dichanthelium oligosanthes]